MDNWRWVRMFFEPLIVLALVGFIAIVVVLGDYKLPSLFWRLLVMMGGCAVLLGVIALVRHLLRH